MLCSFERLLGERDVYQIILLSTVGLVLFNISLI